MKATLIVKVGILAAILMSPSGFAWQPGTISTPMPSQNFGVNNADRNDVVAFWHAVYMASEGYEQRVRWTGDYAGNNGATSADFVDDVERRLNFFRAICGLHSKAAVNSGLPVVVEPEDDYIPDLTVSREVAAQAGALMMVRTYMDLQSYEALDHNPPQTVVGWCESAWNGNAHGNLAFGVYGPGAVNRYVLEENPRDVLSTEWNVNVGHRRWCLYPRGTNFATGDQPGSYVVGQPLVPPTNVLYVSQTPDEYCDGVSPGFVTYPPAGYFPAALNSPFWSISMEGADFKDAAVTVKDQSGVVVPITGIVANSFFGDPAMIWKMPANVAVKSVYNDTSYTVSVTGIKGCSVPTRHTYRVTLIDPDRLVDSHAISGSSKPVVGKSAKYSFTAPSGAESIIVGVSKYEAAKWTETAESGKASSILDGTSFTYPLVCSMSQFPGFGSIEGKNAFRLTFPVCYDMIRRCVPEQSFELNREIIAGSGAKLSFQFKRGLMSTDTRMVVESSCDGGVSWKALTMIAGGSNTNYVPTTDTRKIALAASSSPVRVRFRLYAAGSTVFAHHGLERCPTGIFIDSITVTNCTSLRLKRENVLSGTKNVFTLNKTTAGTKLVAGDYWGIRMRAKLGGKWFPYGPVKKVKIAKKKIIKT